jgi:hypothetical protein
MRVKDLVQFYSLTPCPCPIRRPSVPSASTDETQSDGDSKLHRDRESAMVLSGTGTDTEEALPTLSL